MELLHIFIAAVVVFQGGLVAANNLPSKCLVLYGRKTFSRRFMYGCQLCDVFCKLIKL